MRISGPEILRRRFGAAHLRVLSVRRPKQGANHHQQKNQREIAAENASDLERPGSAARR